MKKIFVLCLIVFFFLVILFVIHFSKEKQSPLPTKDLEVIPNGLGVNIKRNATNKDIELISKAGFKWVRVDVTWERIEKQKGKYDFKNSGYDRLNKVLEKANLKPYYVLSYSNNLYEAKRSIVTERGRKAFSKFVEATTYRYRNQGAVWEIWNEPNSKTFWDFQPGYEQYAELVKKAAPIIKKQDRSGIVVAPAISGVNDESLFWLEKFFEENTLDYIDAISVHPYRYSSPESVFEDYDKLKRIIEHYTDQDIPIISGEWGYSTVPSPYQKLTDLKQAEYLVRMFLVNSQKKIPISIWYDWKNDGIDANSKEQNFGIVRSNHTKKIGYLAVQNFTEQLDGYKFSRKIQASHSYDFVSEFKNKQNKKILVFWTTKSPHTTSFKLKGGVGEVNSMLGENHQIKWGNKVKLTITTSPSYLEIK
ncbi:cellulase family glycosylhydrolase [Priestia aryabhattai]|uniref:cellulase family glycosylhydrolase n=1 Tax=Priestia aryabhattai TaxID=412384 RepID=UPI0007AC0B34|nr:cellulase family glycosylhydrolase [Priestia aryabhattai]KZE14007.1 hypothetical protein AVW12_22060 [Priestia aryabhattai]